MTSRILIVEDNDDLARGLANNLEIEGFAVEIAHDGTRGLERLRASRPDLLILDLMLPGMDGYRVLSTLRDNGDDVPVLILTARTEEKDKVRGFREGADDYVTKPFGLLELIGRVHALLRRAKTARDRIERTEPPFKFGNVEVVPGTHDVFVDGTPVNLRPKEYDLLLALFRRRGSVAGRRSVGLRCRRREQNGRHSHWRATEKARGRSSGAAAHSYGSKKRIPTSARLISRL